jgi:hydrogenase maturation protease
VRLRVIGVGSPDGDDAVGFAIARRLLREGVPPDVEVIVRSRPGLDLLDDLRSADGVVLVDALCGGDPGAVLRVPVEQLAADRNTSHAFGVAAALSLAEALDVRLPQLRIVAVDVGSGARANPGAPLSRAVREAIGPACERVRAELRELFGVRLELDQGARS